MAEHLICNQEGAGSNPAAGTTRPLRLTAHQPLFLPWLGFFGKLAEAEQFVIFDTVPLERHGFSNRNLIKTQQGMQWLTVPVKMNGHIDRALCEVEIASGPWQRKHLRAIELAYWKTPYFERYFFRFKEIYLREWRYLAALDRALLDWLLCELGISIPILCASEQDFRGVKSDLVLDMCRKMGATTYIFGAMGRHYADVTAFEQAGVKVEFQNYRHPVYPQLHGDFVPGLSVLDLLMNVGPRSLAIICGKQYE